MTLRVRTFIREFIKDRNATQAYIRAGYKARDHVATVNASRLLTRADVAAEIARIEAEILDEVQEDVGLSLEVLLREVARGALFDIRKLFDANGAPKYISELDDDTASCISGFEVTEQIVGSGDERVAVGRTFKYKLADRAKWADMGMKALGGYKRDNEQANPVNALVDLLTNMRRSAIPVVQEVPRDDAL